MNLNLIKKFKHTIEQELDKSCNEIIKQIDSVLIPKANDPTSKVFYLKMKADYYRYIAEYSNEREQVVEKASQAYSDATKIANSELETTDPIRLGLALNYSVFFYEIKEDPREACQMAKKAFDEAIVDIENIKDTDYKDSTTIMQLMRDNLTLWTQELEEEDAENDNDN